MHFIAPMGKGVCGTAFQQALRIIVEDITDDLTKAEKTGFDHYLAKALKGFFRQLLMTRFGNK